MKKLILAALMVAAAPLPELFIYKKNGCVLQEHLVADKIKVRPAEHSIWLFSKDGDQWFGITLLIQAENEYHIKDDKKAVVITLDGEQVVEATEGVCK